MHITQVSDGLLKTDIIPENLGRISHWTHLGLKLSLKKDFKLHIQFL